MKSINEKIYHETGYNLHTVLSKKFKTTTIVIKFQAPLERETVTKRALLPNVLQQGTSSYPSSRELRRAFDDLYGAIFSVDTAKKGENHIISFRMEVVNEVFLSKSNSLLKQALNLLHEIIFKPNLDEGIFKSSIVNREKQNLVQRINSIKDDKMSFANMRLIDEMCKGEAYSVHVHGYLEELEGIDASNLFNYYQTVLETDKVDIYVNGDINEDEVKQEIKDHFKRNTTTVNEVIKSNKDVSPKEPREIVERQNLQQGKLHIGYRTNITFSDEKYFALQLFNGLFGGFPHSKLFVNVREKHSLAYYAASRFESHKGLILLFSGIAPNDFKKAKEIIEEQLNAMKTGDFSNDEVDKTKALVMNQLQETMDNAHGLIEVLYHQVLGGIDISPDEMLKKIDKVTKEDIVSVAKQVQLDTVYFLTREEGVNA